MWMEAVCSSETSLSLCWITGPYIPEYVTSGIDRFRDYRVKPTCYGRLLYSQISLRVPYTHLTQALLRRF
jgi:hypothetical protein